MSDWQHLKNLVAAEFVQSKAEGRSISAVDALSRNLQTAGNDPHRLLEIWDALQDLSIEEGFPFDEPSTLEAIQAKRPNKQ